MAGTTNATKKLGRMLMAAGGVLLALAGVQAQAQLYPGVGCVATLESRSVPVDQYGMFALPNIPVNPGKYRVRVICPQPDGTTLGSTSDYLTLVPNGSNSVPLLPLTPLTAQPSSILLLNLHFTQLSAVGATIQLQTQAIDPTGYATDATLGTAGTTYDTSNASVATVSADGLVTATGPGTVVITARNDGLVSTIMLSSFAAVDSDGDGMPDAYEIANGLNPYDPTDANADSDHDGLTNLQEYQLGTNPMVADTDGDGLTDGQEIALGTNPLVADTDGDGLSDGDEVRLGTNPLNPDTDGDGIPDGVEVKLGLNPLVPDVTTTVVGHVTKGDGSPFSGATVVLLTYFTATTDSTGAFTLQHIPTSLGNLVVSARVVNGTQVLAGASTATPPVNNGTTDVGTIQLGKSAGQVSGIVSTAANKPVNLAQVTVVDGNDTRTTTTDSNGLYVFAGLQAGGVVIAVFDPATSLRGQASGTLQNASPLTLNVTLGGYGTVSGTVLTPAGSPVGAGVAVSIAGSLSAQAVTDSLGKYSFPFVPLGGVTVDATDANGNHGRASGTVTSTAQTLHLDVQYLGRATVTGTVTDATSAPVGGAAISLRNNSVFGQQLTATTNSLGVYTIPNVFVGAVDVSASNPATQTAGSTSTNVQSDGQTVTANITLSPAGTINGTVYRANGTTVVAGATVSLNSSGLQTTTGSDGKYTLQNVPLRGYTVTATDASTSDRGQATTTLNSVTTPVTANVTLAGLGSVVVTVKDGGGTLITGALVTVNSGNPFYQQQQGVSGADGTTTINQQLAGTESVNATDPTTGLVGSAQVTLAAGGTASVTVNLQSAGAVQGTVFRIDGSTPVAGATVSFEGRSILTGADGKYAFATVPVGTHSLRVTDAVGNLLAHNDNVTVASQGQVVTANFIIIGRGTVQGVVSDASGNPVGGVPVQLTSNAPGAGNALGTQTDVNGKYTILLAPVGTYTVVAQQHTSISNAYGTATGSLASDGGTATTNITLSSALIPSTQTLTDANGQQYPIRETGALVNGTFSEFAGDSANHQGGSVLSLVTGGTETPFTGSAFSKSDLGGQQVSIEQDGLDGLNVTRRIYVPADGYFARYIELLSNPSNAAVTVGVKLTTNFRDNIIIVRTNSSTRLQDPPHILLTSSGDNLLNIADPTTPDSWVTVGASQDNDPFLPDVYADQFLPPVADVFDGPGAALKPTTVTFGQDAANTYTALTESYNTVTVPAGATVGILHFISQENVYAAANAAAARLAQLPPEALAGMTQADIATVANWVVPAQGVSTVTPLPALTASVSGVVYANDGATPIPNAGVTFQSTDPIFQRLYFGGTDSTGAYNFTGSLRGYAVPAENFTVNATHPATQVISPNYSGTFATGSTAAAQDIIFSNTGTITGTISRGPTVLNVSGTVLISGGSLSAPITVNVAADGTYRQTGLPAGGYTLIARVTNTLLSGQTSATVTVGQTSTVNITIGESGNIQGLVTRANSTLAVGDVVNLRGGGNVLQAGVDTSGHYQFTDIPIGTYTVDAYDTQTNAAASATVTVATNATATANLALVSSGTVNGVVSVNDGSSVAGLTITLTGTTSNGTQTLSTTTDSTGHYSFTNVTPGTIVLRTTTPGGLQGAANGSLPLAGQTVTLNLNLTAAGSVSGTVFQADGTTPAAGLQITITPSPITGSATTTTDASGHYSFALIPIGGFTVYAANLTNGDRGQSAGQIQTNGQARTINITLTGVGSLVITLKDANSHVVANASVVLNTYSISKTYTQTTDSTGVTTFSNVYAGSYTVSATDPVTGLNAFANGTLTPNTTTPIALTLQATGTIKGFVYGPDGTTPVSGAKVSVDYNGSTTTGADGSYTIANNPLGYFTVRASDASGRVRDIATSIYLAQNGSVVTHNFTFVGLGTVTGTVKKVDGTVLENATLALTTSNTVIGGNQSTTTGGDGTYTFQNVPVGNFNITVQNLDPSLAGFGTGKITADGDTETVNIQLTSSSITLPTTLTDADGYTYTVSTDGTFRATGSNGGLSPFYLAQSLTVGGTTFGNGSVPTTSIASLNGQQVEINQPSLAGLNVTRKIYVPTDGYFARRLDVLQNTTASPITVNVTLSGPERYVLNAGSYVITTSNGTATVDNTVQWAVDDDDQNNALPFPRSQPAIADVFSGTGGSHVPDSVSSNVYYSGSFYGNYYLHYWYNYYYNVVVPANGSVSLLTFTAQEVQSSTATSAAQRLVQLPAEALAGLSSTDLASVINFKIPTAPLAAVTAPTNQTALSGTVFAGDGTTPIPNAKVYAQSTDLYYGTGITTTADAKGVYSAPALTAPSYAAEAVDPGTGVTSVAATGTFTPNATTQTQNILFTGTGILQGLIQGTGMTTFQTGITYAYWSCPGVNYCGNASTTYGVDGKFTFLTLPAGNDQISSNIYSPQGGSIYFQVGVNVAANTTTQFTYTIPATGLIAGTVYNADGTVAAGVHVSINGATKYFGASTTTDNAGHYAFSSVPLDNYTVYALDPATNTTVNKSTTVTTDTTSTVDLTFIGHGTVVATVKYANGNTGQNALLYISTSTNTSFTYAGYTDSNGQYTFQNVPTGSYSIRAFYPNQNFYSVTTNTMTGTGQTIQQAVTLTPVGTISGTVTTATGTPAPNVYVVIADSTGQYQSNAQTDSAGTFGFFPVPADRTVSLYSDLPNNPSNHTVRARADNQQVPGDGKTLTVTLRYPGFATVKVTAYHADKTTPYTVGYIYLKSTDGTQSYGAAVDSTGTATFTNVSEGALVANYNYNTEFNPATATFTLAPADDGTTKQVNLYASPSGTLKGIAYASDGTTVLQGGYTVTVKDIDTGNTHDRGVGDVNGYEFDSVTVGASGYSISARLNSSNTAQATATGNITTDGQTITKNFTLPVSAITGTVYMSDGTTPVQYANVYAIQTINGTDTSYNATADVNGNFQIAGAVTGQVTLTAVDNNGVYGTLTVTLNSDTQVLSGQKIQLGPAGTVQGTVYDDQHNAMTYQEVDINSTGGQYGSTYIVVYTDQNGFYSASDVPIGNVTVETYNSTTNTTLSNSDQLANAGDTLTIDIGTPPSQYGPGAKIFGTVYDGDQNPNQGATVTATDSTNATFTATTDENGMYTINSMAVGDISVYAVLSDGTTKTDTITGNVPDDVTPIEFDLGLTDPGTVQGQVTDNAGNPVGGVDIWLNSTGDPNSAWVETNGTDGYYGFGEIPPGQISISIQVHDSDQVLGTATGTLPYGGNVTINVKLPAPGAKLQKLQIRLQRPGTQVAELHPAARLPVMMEGTGMGGLR